MLCGNDETCSDPSKIFNIGAVRSLCTGNLYNTLHVNKLYVIHMIKCHSISEHHTWASVPVKGVLI